MVKSVGAELVLVGHSERRSVFKESNADINRGLKQVLAHAMVPVLCVGETLQEYESGSTAPVDLVQGSVRSHVFLCIVPAHRAE
jgi:triosephosphate isomerase